jgi:hypothetical protein
MICESRSASTNRREVVPHPAPRRVATLSRPTGEGLGVRVGSWVVRMIHESCVGTVNLPRSRPHAEARRRGGEESSPRCVSSPRPPRLRVSHSGHGSWVGSMSHGSGVGTPNRAGGRSSVSAAGHGNGTWVRCPGGAARTEPRPPGQEAGRGPPRRAMDRGVGRGYWRPKAARSASSGVTRWLEFFGSSAMDNWTALTSPLKRLPTGP